MTDVVYFKDRKEWRSWLEQHHDNTDYIWLVHYKKKSNKKGITIEEAVEEAICFGWIDGKLQRIDDEKHQLRYSPRKNKSVWSKINRERAEKMIESGRMTQAGLIKIEAAKQSGAWHNAYTNKTEEKIPSDLKKALTQDTRAWNNFQKFANSYRNMYIGWINDAKTGETRIKRIQKVVEQSIQNKKYAFL